MQKAAILLLALVLMAPALAFARGPSPAPQVVRITGVVTAIDSANQQIIVAGVVVQVTPNTLIQMDGAEVSFETLTEGMTVRVCGHVISDVLFADKINIMYKGK